MTTPAEETAEPLLLILPIGLPGCGKTTRTRRWVSAAPGKRARVSRDMIRADVLCRPETRLDVYHETLITGMLLDMTRSLLRAGHSVVIDATNLAESERRVWNAIAVHGGAELETWDMRDVPLETCIRQDRLRGEHGGHSVGPGTIRRLAQTYLPPPNPPLVCRRCSGANVCSDGYCNDCATFSGATR